MAKQLLAKEVNEALVANLLERTAALREKGVRPTLGIIRVGARPDDLSYVSNKARTSQHFNPDFFRQYAVQEEVNTAGLRLLSLGKACSQS